MKKLLLLIFAFNLILKAQTTRTWTGAGANNNWNTAANWSGGVVPTTNDTVIFNSTSSKNCVLNNPATITVAKFIIENTFTGTITQNTARNLTIQVDFIMMGGTYTPLGTGAFTVGNDFILDGGNFTKSTGTMTISNGDFTINSGSYNKGTGGNLNINTGDFYLNGGTFNMGSGGNLTLNNGSIFLNSGNFNKSSNGNISSANGFITINGGEFNSTGTGGTITLTNSGIEIFSGKFKSGSETISATSGTIYLESGEFEATNSIINVQDVYLIDGTIKLNNSTFNPNFYFQESGTFFGGNGKHNFGSSGVELYGGLFNSTSDTSTIRNNFQNDGAIMNHNNGTYVFNINPSNLDIQGIDTLYNVWIQNNGTGGTARTLNLNTALNVLNTLRITYGSGTSTRRVILNNSPIYLAGNLIIDGTSTSNNIASGNSKIIMSSSNPRTISVNSSVMRSKFINEIEIASPSQVSISGKLALTSALTVNDGASLTLSTDSILINGNLTVDGSINHNNGTVTFFKGVNNQNNEIGGASTIGFNNVFIWRTGSFANSYVDQFTSVTLAGSLDFSNASSRFRTNGQSFTILSTSSGTGRIGIISNSNQFDGGSITMQRFIPASSGRYWYHFGSPLSNVSMSDIKATYTNPAAQDPDTGIFINGSAIANASPAIPSLGISNGTTPSVFQFNPNSTNPWIAPTDVNAEMSNRYAYRFFIRDGSASRAPTTGAKLLSFSGNVRKLSQPITLTYQENGGSPISDGWVYLVNPYPSDITGNLNKPGAYTHTGLSFTTVYIWDAPSGNWRTRTPSDSSQFVNIPSTKAFMIRVVPSGGNLIINESAKVKGSASFNREESIIANYLPIKLKNNSTGIFDITSLKYDSIATYGFDNDMDAYKLTFSGGNSASVTIHSYINDLPASINNKPGFNLSGDTTQLFINCPNGLNTLSFYQTAILPDTIEAFLIDQYSNTITDIKSNPVYEFQVTTDTLSKFKRFFIVYKSKEKVTGLINNKVVESVSIYPNPNFSGTFYLTNKYKNSSKVEIFNTIGEKTATIDKNLSDNSFTLPNNLSKGVYFVRIQSENLMFTEKLILQ
ncbi:MAG: T9SS type A sorting domain-containing protein [Cytophagales bacterium]